MHDHIDRGRYPRHSHPHSEFLLVMEGDGVIDTDRKECREQPAQPGDLFVISRRNGMGYLFPVTTMRYQ